MAVSCFYFYLTFNRMLCQCFVCTIYTVLQNCVCCFDCKTEINEYCIAPFNPANLHTVLHTRSFNIFFLDFSQSAYKIEYTKHLNCETLIFVHGSTILNYLCSVRCFYYGSCGRWSSWLSVDCKSK